MTAGAVTLLTDIVESRTVTLVGSAPGASLDGQASDLLVCVNAAALGLALDIRPDITIFNTAFATLDHLDYGRQTRSRLHQLRTRLLLVVDLANAHEDLDTLFSPIERAETRRLTVDQRCSFLERFTGKPLTGRAGPDHVPSTGFFSCLYLLASGAREVRMRGFSFGDGHSYIDSTQKRAHTARDLEAMELILARGYPVLFEDKLQQQYANLRRPPAPRPSLLKYC